jgi:hypothetical protein
MQERLDGVTWLGRSAALALAPELEEWLWCCPESIARHLGADTAEFEKLFAQAVAKLERTPERARRELPKELFELVVYGRRRRKPLPEDFSKIAERADLELWLKSASFARLAGVLRTWFPAETS